MREIEVQTFREITQDLTEPQMDYLALLVKGIEQRAALQITGRVWRALNYWRADEKFKRAEDLIKADRDQFLTGIDDHFSGKIAKIEMGLINLAGRIADWENLEAREKGHVLKACSLVKIVRGLTEKSPEGYEERLRRG